VLATLTHEQMAHEYLARQFGPDAPVRLRPVAAFDEPSLEGEGAVTIFSFTASRGDNPPQAFYVFAGDTDPNYYPDWDLSPDDAYCLHLGTRFMLVLDVTQIPLTDLPPMLEDDITASMATVAPGEAVEKFRPVIAFGLDGQRHAVCRLRLGGEDLYVLGGDLPLGIYRRTDLPPHVVYRLHLGKLIRMEAQQEED
jgi:hypothetical protein